MAEMTVGQDASTTVGPSGSAVATNTTSDFFRAVQNVVFMATALDVYERNSTAPVMSPGQGLLSALGGNADVYGRPDSDLTGTAMGMMVSAGIVGTLLSAATYDSTTPEQKQAAYAQEEARKADLAKEDAQKEQAVLDDERRKAFFAKKGPGM
jgi:hypothetical protein